MPFTEYVSTIYITDKIDEEIIAGLVNRDNSKTWYKKALDGIKTRASDLFESYAANVYSVPDELRIDPVPAFAQLHVFNIIRYMIYADNKRHQVPIAVQNDYDDTMEILKKWGNPQILDAAGNIVTASSSSSGVSVSYEDLEFPYYTVANKMWGN